mgnify:CR=1 FL=1
MEYLLIGIILTVVVVLSVRSVYRTFSGKDSDVCASGCAGCSLHSGADHDDDSGNSCC